MEKALRIQLRGKKGDVHNLAFGLFSHQLSMGQDQDAPGGVKIEIESDTERELIKRQNEAYAPWTLAIHLRILADSDISKFADWFCDKWTEKAGNKVLVELDNSPCVCDHELLKKAIDDAAA